MSGPRNSKRQSANVPVILLTGRRDNRRHLVELRGRAVWLTFGEFTTLCALACALLLNAAGTCPLEGMAVRRLRRAIDRGVGREGFGKELIHAASDGEYFLALTPDQIGADASFRVLAPRYIDAVTKETILARLPRLPLTTDH